MLFGSDIVTSDSSLVSYTFALNETDGFFPPAVFCRFYLGNQHDRLERIARRGCEEGAYNLCDGRLCRLTFVLCHCMEQLARECHEQTPVVDSPIVIPLLKTLLSRD